MKMMPGLITILALSPFVLSCVAATPEFRDDAGRILPASVARMKYVVLGGVKQWICVRGVSVDKPLLLILHGGPGTPEALPFRRYDAGLEKDFIVDLSAGVQELALALYLIIKGFRERDGVPERT